MIDQKHGPAAAPEIHTAEASLEAPNLFAGRRGPIVLNIKKKKGKKKRKYSGSLKDVQVGMRRGLKASDKLADAISAGIGKYRKRSDKSSKKRRDGMLRDALQNSASALGTTLRKSSNVPEILAKSVRRRTVRRSFRLANSVFRFMR